jgi:pilus assembly protein CpaB
MLITRKVNGPDGNSQVTDVLLQNVRVIAIDQNAKNSDGTPAVARTATLEVNPIDAQKLALAQQVGDLGLVLRKPGEQDNPVVETVSMNDLRYNVYGGARYPAPAVIGNFGSAIGGSMTRSATQISSASRPVYRRSTARAKAALTAPPAAKPIEVYRGTQSDQVQVGGNGR